MATKHRGRPKVAHRLRYPLRHDQADREAFERAAATCGKTLQVWALETLRAEAAKATHVPMLKRSGRAS
jgi:hypothetical protein